MLRDIAGILDRFSSKIKTLLLSLNIELCNISLKTSNLKQNSIGVDLCIQSHFLIDVNAIFVQKTLNFSTKLGVNSILLCKLSVILLSKFLFSLLQALQFTTKSIQLEKIHRNVIK